MTLNQLRYFCGAARNHSITRAAREFYVTQPTISSAIRELEIEFSMSLFYRTGNQLVLTEEGERFYERASDVLHSCTDLQDDFSSQSKRKSYLRIGIPPVLSIVFFPSLLDAFHEVYPDILIRLEEYGSVRACEMVQNDHLDLALVNMEMYNLSKLNSHVLTQDQIVYCVSPEHPLSDRSFLEIRDLTDEQMIFLNSDSVQNQLLNTRFEALNIRPQIIMRSSQLYTTLKFVRQGKYGCFLFSSILNQIPSIIGIPLNPPVQVKIGLVWKKGKFISNRMNQFLDFAINSFLPDIGKFGS
ncbi:MAG: LysR family transcriptional regulator [Clostridiales bacterium]|nr:LysR family transcriptional regulator [Clostridiales bacterium]